ncbi:MAG: hypothetical protein WCK39_06240 [Methanomassiliicoccales archaeon]
MRASRRSASGKEVALTWEQESGLVTKAFLSGDFFAYPEEGVASLARSLVGLPASSLATEGRAALRASAEEVDLVLIGITLDDVLALLEEGR